MRRQILQRVGVLAVLLTSVTAAFASDRHDPQAAAALLEQYADPSTVFIGRITISEIDIPALKEEIRRTVEASGLNEREQSLLLGGLPSEPMREAAAAWFEALAAEGGNEIYVLLSLTDFFVNMEPSFFVIVPTAEEVDATRVRRLLFSGDVHGREVADEQVRHPLLPGWTTEVFDDAVVLAMGSALTRLREQSGHALPNLAEALAAVENWAVQLLIVPTGDTRRVMRELMPAMPDGTRPGAIVDRGMQWLAMGLNLPPEPALRLRVQGEDAEAARDLADLIAQVQPLLEREVEREAPAMVGPLSALLEQLEPTVEGRQLRVEPDAEAFREAATTSAGVFLQVRLEAVRMQSRTQLRGLHQASVMWAQGQQPREGEQRRPMASDPGKLLLGNYFTAEWVLHPLADMRVPSDFNAWPDERRRQWVNEHASYVLIPGLVEDLDGNRVAGFEKPEVTDARHIAVVFNDNHVRDVPLDEARALIEEQTGMTLEELAEQQARAGVDETDE
ncbi:hypothetical protein ACERK3_17165 [Phycisphaerales bacterium AB-hyl4]|uniref:DUF1559 domain-containing protein n=1 Tax=Natronomicrosphaera hydrolytica TaxID=3242702 RepID=A0ABV4UAU5_9BACT